MAAVGDDHDFLCNRAVRHDPGSSTRGSDPAQGCFRWAGVLSGRSYIRVPQENVTGIIPLVIDSEGPRKGILEKRNLWRHKSEHCKQHTQQTDGSESKPGMITLQTIIFEGPPLEKK